jgi:hypothetical protein
VSQHTLLHNPFCLTGLKCHIHPVLNSSVFLDFYLNSSSLFNWLLLVSNSFKYYRFLLCLASLVIFLYSFLLNSDFCLASISCLFFSM